MTYVALPDQGSSPQRQDGARPGEPIAIREKAAGKRVGKRERKRASPIGRLTERLLARVFWWYILDVCSAAASRSHSSTVFRSGKNSADTGTTWKPAAPYSWLRIRHVSREWRSIALAHPELSSQIFLTHPECVQDMLNRLGTATFSVYDAMLDYTTKNKDRVATSCKLVLAHADRIVHGSFTFVEEMFSEGYVVPYAKLYNAETLKLVSLPGASAPFLSNLHLPQLLQLSCSLPIHTLDAPSLRALSLVGSAGNTTTADELLTLLETGIPGLEELVLDLALAEDESWPHIHDETLEMAPWSSVTLPWLRQVRIRARYATTALHFLYRVVHSPATAVDLSFTHVSQSVHSYCDCLSTMLLDMIDGWSTLDDLPFCSLCIESSGNKPHGAFTLALSQHNLTLDGATHTCDAFFRLSADAAEPIDQTFFLAILPALPLDRITSAAIHTSGAFWHMLNWTELLHALPALEDLRLAYETHRGPWPRGGVRAHAGDDALVPRLRTLSVHEARVYHLDPSHSVPLAQFAQGIAARSELAQREGAPGVAVRVSRDAMVPWPRTVARSKVSRWISAILPSRAAGRVRR